MKPAPVLALAGLAAGAAAIVDAQGAPAAGRNVLLVIAGVLAAVVVLPALFSRWPGEEPRPPWPENPHGTQLDDLALTSDDRAAIIGRPSPR